jgi:GAF domain-containing protein
MPKAPLRADESNRLRALRASHLLEKGSDRNLDAIVKRAAALFEAPIAAISLLTETKQRFMTAIGLGVPYTSREVAFCGYAILGTEPLLVLDAKLDPRFADNALVLGAPGIRFYVGAPVFGPAGRPFGALCVIDVGPRPIVSQGQLASLRVMAAEVTASFAQLDGDATNIDKRK